MRLVRLQLYWSLAKLDRAVSSAVPAGRTTPVEFGCLAPFRVRHVADLQQQQAASPPDLQIAPDFPEGKRDQTRQTEGSGMGVGSVCDAKVKFV